MNSQDRNQPGLNKAPGRPGNDRGNFRRSPEKPAKRLIRDDIADLDRDILRMLMRRHNLLEKIKVKGRVDPAEEKYLREAWQHEVARVSRDTELSGRFFSLMQEVGFLPKPSAAGSNAADAATVPGSARREAFNLAPPRHAVKIALQAPLDDILTRSWLYMAAAAGEGMHIAPLLQNDPIIDCVKALIQLGSTLTREEDAVLVRPGSPAGRPDRVVHAGDSEFNFYLLAAHYLGRYSRVKITGDTALKLADFSPLRRALPALGARLVHVVPKSCGLPARLECSGLLPAAFEFTADLPGDFALALILAAPFYEQPFGIDLSTHPKKQEIFARVLPILDACGITYRLSGSGAIGVEPCMPAIPQSPSLPLDPLLAAFLAAFASALGGEAKIQGAWPQWAAMDDLWAILATLAPSWQKNSQAIDVAQQAPIDSYEAARLDSGFVQSVPESFIPLIVALASCAALRGGNGSLPPAWRDNDAINDFLASIGLETGEDGKLARMDTRSAPRIWTAPSPSWAMALALSACSRPSGTGFQLGNPGIMTTLWPMFWAFYNSLPQPQLKKENEAQAAPVARRRIITNVIAQVPELKDEDL